MKKAGFFDLIKKDKNFYLFTSVMFLLCGSLYTFAPIAAWLGFVLAAYSAIANDSIQTIGTFITSNKEVKWWKLWLFIGIIFLATMTFGWLKYDGDVTYQRLASKGFSESPTSFGFLQIAAPIFLLIITRWRMPVSTTFLLLSSFTTSAGSIGKMLTKSMYGYGLSFVVAIVVWLLLSKLISKYANGKPSKWWNVAQWITSGSLWAVWLMQDAANIAVYLPRQLGIYEFIGFAGFIFLGLGLLFYLKGDKIQKVVDEKSYVNDVRSATIIDLVYAFILYYFQNISSIPMSTTWVFLGLLAGREIAINIIDKKTCSKKVLKMIGKDVMYAAIGLLVSVLIAMSVNPVIREEIINMLK